MEKNVADFRSKLGDEVNAKARVDTDYIRATKVNKHLEEICRKKGLWDSIEKDTEDVNDDDKRSLSPGSVDQRISVSRLKNLENANLEGNALECTLLGVVVSILR